jgi:hypothetical protein
MRFTTSRQPKSVADFLSRQDDGAAALMPAARRLLRLQEDLFATVPAALRAGCDVAASGERAIVLHVTSASIAAKLRQMLPRITEGLTARGWSIDEVRVRVRPRAIESVTRPTRTLAISPVGVDAFESLGATLEPSDLKDAVERLVRRRRPA